MNVHLGHCHPLFGSYSIALIDGILDNNLLFGISFNDLSFNSYYGYPYCLYIFGVSGDPGNP